MRLFIPILFLCLPSPAKAQAIDNVRSYHAPGDHYMRLTYDNDFFTATDRYYTQGIGLEYASPAVQKSPHNKILLHPFAGSEVAGISIEHNAYTPSNIIPSTVLYNDHPYTAALMLRAFRIVTDTVRLRRFSATLSLGVLGSHASGKWMQESIHRWLDNVQPGGWKHQLKNDVVINYNIHYEQLLLSAGEYIQLHADAALAAGTLNNRLSAGFSLVTGYIRSPYLPRHKGARAYLYAHPQVSAVAYDATLQGGIFTTGNTYTIPASQVERFVFTGQAGIVLCYAGLSLEHFYAISSREFSTQGSFYWGGLRLGVSF